MFKLLCVFLLLLGMGGAVFWHNFQQALERPVIEGRSELVNIEKGETFQSIVNKLEGQKILEQPLWFKILAFMEGSRGQLKAGEYKILPGTSCRQLLAQLVEGKSLQYSLTLIEGWVFKQILSELSRHTELQQTLTDLDNQQIMALLITDKSSQAQPALAQLDLAWQHPEGWFYPDTYFFSKGDSDLAVLKRAYQKMQTELGQAWQQRASGLPIDTPYETLILASIVEKETGKAEERARIAGVFERRLQQDMRLQTDPTVIYGMGERYQGNIRRRDLREDTPWNTYVHKGLPPTPIAMPGREAIHAVLHPDYSDNSLFFVANGEGGHVFSETLKAHNQAVGQYLKKLKMR